MKGLLTSQEQDGWRELINKEVFCRISWKAKYGRKYPQRLPDHGISRQKCLLPDMYLPKEDSSSRNREGVPQKEDRQEPAEGKVGLSLQEPLPEMRVPTPETTQLLYKGFSYEGKGRQQYLKERMMKSPEEKFWYPVLSSWEYGWRLVYLLMTIGYSMVPATLLILSPACPLLPVNTYNVVFVGSGFFHWNGYSSVAYVKKGMGLPLQYHNAASFGLIPSASPATWTDANLKED